MVLEIITVHGRLVPVFSLRNSKCLQYLQKKKLYRIRSFTKAFGK